MAKKSPTQTQTITEIIQPIRISVGYRQLAFNKYCSYVIKSQGEKILEITESEPMPLYMAMNEAKVNFVTQLMDKHDSETYDKPDVDGDSNE